MNSMNRCQAVFATTLAGAALTGISLAQPAGMMMGGGPGTYSGQMIVDGSYSLSSGINLGTRELGDISTARSRLNYTGLFRASDTLSWRVGLEYERFDFSRPTGAALPPYLASLSVPLGVNWRISDRWSAFGNVAPGVYSDFVDVRSDDLNAPVLAGVSYAVNERFQILVAVSIDLRRDVPIVGGPGFIWRINDDLRLDFVIPRPRLTWNFAESFGAFVGAEITGGAYHLNERFGTDRGMPSLDNNYVAYREIRAGAGLNWGGREGFSGTVEAGWMFDRRFVIDEARTQFNGDGAFYFQAALNYRY
jgi:hypothetical protein